MVATIIEWILSEGLDAPDPERLLEGMIHRLRAAGLPVDRMAFGFDVLHPLVAIQTIRWSIEDGTDAQDLPFTIRDDDGFLKSPLFAVLDTQRPLRRRLLDRSTPRDYSVLPDLDAAGYTDYIVMPVPLRGRQGAPMSLATRAPDGFPPDAIDTLTAVLRAAGPIIALMRAEQMAVNLLSTYVGPGTGQRILDGKIRPGDADPIEAVLWLCDLRGFTALTEALGSAAMIPLVNTFFDTMSGPLVAHGGEILKFMGDAMLAIFPSTGTEGPTGAAGRAVTAAQAALDALAVCSSERVARGEPALETGIALHFGQVLYGNIGAQQRLDFTVFGGAVNRLARIEELCAPLGSTLLMSGAVARRCGRPVKSRGLHPLKGLHAPMELFELA